MYIGGSGTARGMWVCTYVAYRDSSVSALLEVCGYVLHVISIGVVALDVGMYLCNVYRGSGTARGM